MCYQYFVLTGNERRKDVIVAKTKGNNGLYCKQKTEGYRKVCILSVFVLTSVGLKKGLNLGTPKWACAFCCFCYYQWNFHCRIMSASYFCITYYKLSLFNAHAMILIVHVCMNVDKLCLNQLFLLLWQVLG